jgi:hypothetical protein
MQGVDSLQARREAQAQARKQAAAQAMLGSPAYANQMLYGHHMVPPPGVAQAQPVPAPGQTGVYPAADSRLSTPASSERTPQQQDLTGSIGLGRGAPHLDYSSGVFIPAGVEVPTTPPQPSDPIVESSAATTSPTSMTFPSTAAASQRRSDVGLITPPPRHSARPLEDPGALSKLNSAQLATLLPRNQLLLGYVLRERGGLLENPKYRFFLEPRDVFALAGRKRSKKQSSNYAISLNETDLDRDGEFCFAKVRSNFAGTEFVFFTSDRDDKKELGAVLFEINPGGIRGPRRMTVIIPRIAPNGAADEWRCVDDAAGLISEYRQNPDSSKIVVLENKAPQWNEELKGFQLNFNGRIGMPSVKNFQLCDRRDDHQNVVMQFGKWSADRFALDFRYPINATQAFCIALTSFDNKLLCE